MLRSFFSAFLMYSRIPVPKTEWKEENRRYALGFFPLVGAVTGGLLLLWRFVCDRLEIGQLLFAGGAVLIPIIVTGGIHLDGFCDVSDARAACADRERSLEIMKDPHIGSFAVISLCVYLIIQTALFTQVDSMKTAAVIAAGYVVSRGLSAVSAVTFRSAKKDGSLQSFVRPAHRNITLAMDIASAAAGIAVQTVLLPVQGAAAALAALLVMAYHRYSSYRRFGGITGDLCGWFLQLCEIWILAAAVFSERITEVMK
ncbi:MAG: adenosylcobinamide-GDP ribazoletransferase [Ruminococcus sp.]|nr:adenosylcobinamide-GDP ribazoletransferase [Ruminococcus sp.]